jgi:hypothetical protein
MDVEIVIRFSEDRACRVTIARPDGGEIIYMIVTPAAGIPHGGASRGSPPVRDRTLGDHKRQ